AVWPFEMVQPSSFAFSLMALAQDTAQPSPYPSVGFLHRNQVALLEVFKPSAQNGVEPFDGSFDAVTVGAPGNRTHAVVQLLDGFLPRPVAYSTLAGPLETVAQEVEALARRVQVGDAGLLRVQRESLGLTPLPHQFQGRFGLVLCGADDYAVVGIPNHPEALFGHQVVQRV